MTHSVYMVTAPDGRRYIGVTNDLHRRMLEHARARTILGRSIRKHGIKSHRVQVLLIAECEFAYEMEERLIEAFGTLAPHGMNYLIGGVGGWDGRVHTLATRRLLAAKAAARGPRSAAMRARLSASRTGLKCAVPRSPESRAKQSESMRLAWARKKAILAREGAQKAEYPGDKAKADAKNKTAIK